MWGAGIGGLTAAVASWRVVGRGFFWLSSGVVVALGAGAWLGDLGAPAAVGVVAALAGGWFAGHRQWSVAFFALSAVMLAVAPGLNAIVPTITGGVALGGVTVEMLLGHWYLVDPTLPRYALSRLDAVGIVGLGADFVIVSAAGLWAAQNGWAVSAVVVLAATSILLMVGVWYSLKEPAYSGVMAATGLSYLAVLTSLGAVVVGRAVANDGTFLISTIVT